MSAVHPAEALNPLREWVPVDQEPRRSGVHFELGCPMWLMPGELGPITDYTLYEQRMYAFHDNGRWSRPKDRSSTNSLPDET